MADDTVGLLDALGVQKAVVFGGSMGGMITQFLLINHTHRVHAAVLAFTSGSFKTLCEITMVLDSAAAAHCG